MGHSPGSAPQMCSPRGRRGQVHPEQGTVQVGTRAGRLATPSLGSCGVWSWAAGASPLRRAPGKAPRGRPGTHGLHHGPERRCSRHSTFLPGLSLLYLRIIQPGKGDFLQCFVFLKSS